MAKRVKIPGRLESAETGNIVTGADAVMDDEKGKTQVVINSEVDAAIINLAQGKQDVLTFDSAPTEGSPNPVTSAGVYTADKVLSDAIEAILLLIPSAAGSLNKLVDMQTMNSSIATATASFKGTYNLVSDLHLGVDATHEQIGAALDALSLGADSNDYAFVLVPNSATAPTEISKTERFKFNGTNWLYEYDLNNSGFTSPQWNAINSGVTSLLVSKLSNLPTNAELTTLLAGKQDNLTFDNVPTAGSPNPVKSGGVYARNNEIVALINALDAAKQDVLTFDNAPVEGSPNPVKSGGVYTAISAVQAAIVALDAEKQNVLTFDSTPTLGSPNPVTSSGIKTELNRVDGNISTLNDLYEALTQSALVVVQPTDTWPVANPATSTIYRVVDRVNTPPQNYSDYMWNGTTMVLMATYDNAIDPRPKKASQNLVTSGGVFDNMGALDVSELNATENPHTLAQYVDLSAALAAIPTDYQKGGMTIKYVQSSDNKYVQYRLTSNTFSLRSEDWYGVGNFPNTGYISIGQDSLYMGFIQRDATLQPSESYIPGTGVYNVSQLSGHIFVKTKESNELVLTAALYDSEDNAIEISKVSSSDQYFLFDLSKYSGNAYTLRVSAPDYVFNITDDALLYRALQNNQNYNFINKETDKHGYIDVNGFYMKQSSSSTLRVSERMFIAQGEKIKYKLSGNPLVTEIACYNLLGAFDANLSVNLSSANEGEYVATDDCFVVITYSGYDINSNYAVLQRNMNTVLKEEAEMLLSTIDVGSLPSSDGFISRTTGEYVKQNSSFFQTSEPISVNKGDVIDYFLIGNDIVAQIACYEIGGGYNAEKSLKLPSDTSQIGIFVIPEGITSIRVTYVPSNSNYAKLNQSKLEIAVNKKNTIWTGKAMVWFGTSIPAPNIVGDYPSIVGESLGSRIYNEAVGYSCAKAYPESAWQGNNYYALTVAMGNSVEEKLKVFNSLFTLDFSLQTVSWAGNTYNLQDCPYSQSNLPSFDDAKNLLYMIIGYSYQIKLVSKYLDPTGSYLSGVLNSSAVQALGYNYEKLYSSQFDYIETPSLFVIDHGHNDHPDDILTPQNIDSRDMYTFQGAINSYIDLINLYMTNPNIVIVSDYDNYYDTDKTIEVQKQIADNWKIPFLPVCDKLPFGKHIVTVRGYWDNGSQQSGVWQNNGFYFTYNSLESTDWETNNGVILYENTGSTAQQVISKFNIRTENGVQVYDIMRRQMYFKDGLHPTTDLSRKAIIKYAQTLTQLILGIGN